MAPVRLIFEVPPQPLAHPQSNLRESFLPKEHYKTKFPRLYPVVKGVYTLLLRVFTPFQGMNVADRVHTAIVYGWQELPYMLMLKLQLDFK